MIHERGGPPSPPHRVRHGRLAVGTLQRSPGPVLVGNRRFVHPDAPVVASTDSVWGVKAFARTYPNVTGSPAAEKSGWELGFDHVLELTSTSAKSVAVRPVSVTFSQTKKDRSALRFRERYNRCRPAPGRAPTARCRPGIRNSDPRRNHEDAPWAIPGRLGCRFMAGMGWVDAMAADRDNPGNL